MKQKTIRIRNDKKRSVLVPWKEYHGHQLYCLKRDLKELYSDKFIHCDALVITDSGFAIAVGSTNAVNAQGSTVNKEAFEQWIKKTELDQITKGATK